MSNPNRPTYYPRGVNNYVPDMQYAADVGTDGLCTVELGNPVALDADGIMAAQSIAVAGTFTTMAAAYTDTLKQNGLARYGRNVTVVLSGAGTPAITVRGVDYLGQPMSENFTGAGTSPVAGKKAFWRVDSVQSGAVAATTIDVGWGNVFGLPYKSIALLNELYDEAPTANAGTFVGAVLTDPQTATTGDPRGTHATHTSNAPNGTHTYKLLVRCDKNKLHGVRHFYA